MQPVELRKGVDLTRSFESASVHHYVLDLAAGEYVEAVVEQLGVDVIVTVADPASRILLRVDSPNGNAGPEPVYLWAEAGGRYVLEIHASRRDGGSYRLILPVLRTGGAADQHRARAARLFAQGEESRRRGDATGLDHALDAYRAAQMEWRRAGERVWPVEVLERIARIHLAQHQRGEAVRVLEEALRELSSVPDETDLRGRILLQLGQVHRDDRRWPESSRACERAIDVARIAGDASLEAKALNNLALVRKLEGRYEEAAGLYHRALELWRRLRDRRREAVSLSNLGELLTSLGQDRRALEFLTPALDLMRHHGSVRNRARTMMSLGKVQRRLGDLEASREAYLQALALYRSNEEPQGVAEVLLGLGQTEARIGRPQRAEESLRRAEEIFLERQDEFRAGVARLALGWLDDDRGRPAAAAEHFLVALGRLRQAEDPAGQSSALYGLARCAAALGHLEEAIERLQSSLDLIESLRSAAGTPSLKASYLHRRYDYYVFLVELLMRRHEAAPEAGFDRLAWRASERARARAALDLLQASLLRAHLQPPSAGRRGPVPGPGDAGSDGGAEVPYLWNPLGGGDPGGAAILDLERLRQLLGEGTALLAYTLGERRSFFWWITREELEIFTLPARDEIERLVHQACGLLRNQRPDDGLRLQVALAKLSRILLGPVAPRLAGQHLVVAPDGALHYLPFAALPSPAAGEVRPPPPLVAHHRISRIGSASILAAIRQRRERRQAAARTLAVIADPVFERADPRLGGTPPGGVGESAQGEPGATDALRAAAAMGLRRLDRLPATAAEAEMLASLTAEDDRLLVLGFDASRETVLAVGLNGYRIVHFATHGWVQERYPELSGLVLSLYDSHGRAVDGLLRVHEIYDLRLRADLVVLSACRTALGTELRGEGLVGLTQAFQFAGASSVLVSLWNVDDRTTAVLMEHFYRALLRDRRSPSEALRAAQLALQSQDGGRWTEPCYWAGFVLEGDWLVLD